MPRFLVTRTLPPLSREELQGVVQNVKNACDEVGNIKWIRSHLTADGKHSFCEFEATSAAECREHARIAGLPMDDVMPIAFDIGPVPPS